MKKSLIIFASILLLATSIISAYSYSPSSIGDLFDMLGGENLWFLIVFLGSMILISRILLRTGFFGGSNGSAMVLSLLLSLGITYALYTNGISFDITGLFYSFGFSDMAIDLIIFFVTAAILLILLFKLRSNIFLVLGVLFLASGFIGFEGSMLPIIGGALVFIWMMIKYIPFRARNTIYGMPGTNINVGGTKIPKNFNLNWKRRK